MSAFDRINSELKSQLHSLNKAKVSTTLTIDAHLFCKV